MLKTSYLLSSIALAALPAAAFAQEAPASDDTGADQEIIVTGSRIQRRDFEASSPIVTAGEDLFENSSTAAIETAHAS